VKTNLFWDAEVKTIRGSFINMVITFSLAFTIIYAIFFGSEKMIQNLKELQSLIVWFFGLSFSIWSGKQVLELAFSSTGITLVTKNKEQP
jgi:cytosine/uracil/thiamine/allantoin permease